MSRFFLTSEFILDAEVLRLFELHGERGMTLYPLLVSACPWQAVPWLERLQIRPVGDRPIDALRSPTRNKALADVALEIVNLIREVP